MRSEHFLVDTRLFGKKDYDLFEMIVNIIMIVNSTKKERMDLGIIIAVVGVGIAIVGVVIAMMFWVRTEANALRAEAKEDRKDLVQIVYAIKEEMRDFHARLCAIEERRKK